MLVIQSNASFNAISSAVNIVMLLFNLKLFSMLILGIQ